MTVVDTSAIVAVLFDEPDRAELERKLIAGQCVMSAVSRVELGIVVEVQKGPAGTQLLEELLARLDVQIADVDQAMADEAIVAWRRFGTGRHPAGLNLGDVFAYALARRSGEGLLFVGHDFSQTDVDVA